MPNKSIRKPKGLLFKLTYLKSSSDNPFQSLAQLEVNLIDQNIIGKLIRIIFSKSIFTDSGYIDKYNAMGNGATDQKGSYKLEFLKIWLLRKTIKVADKCPARSISHWFE
jgi:hypothetical protein